MKLDFTGKVAVVTGAGQGIGRAISLAYAEHGANIAVLDVRLDEAQAVVEEIKGLGCKGIALKVDVSNSSEVKAAFAKIVDDFGSIDILVNNAGIHPQSLVIDMAEEEWDRVIDVNLKGTFNCSQAAAKIMVSQKSGRIINLSSVAGRKGATRGRAHYGASKAGVLGFTKSLAQELGSYDITVNAICPGTIETDMTRETREKGISKVENIIVGRFGKPEDLLGIVLVLASEAGSFITGATIDINGGFWMG